MYYSFTRGLSCFSILVFMYGFLLVVPQVPDVSGLLERLLGFLETGTEHIMCEALVQMKDLLRRHPDLAGELGLSRVAQNYHWAVYFFYNAYAASPLLELSHHWFIPLFPELLIGQMGELNPCNTSEPEAKEALVCVFL